ncbi:MAG: transglycosylase SLT domain-containing protein [Hydrogenovibrio sp.]|uniref:lytic transglycosylase domain-containing protein n=1 Tax=Hydrogenovibrio sp. TaxID=2065821 RepID=UPI00286FC6B1|nr:transglycosylase SLT domain-containing protein [Hydrogenovibrio sp.]MDR9498635.1 transglycosylase SLT domain-containing protein [Hydrogenovibrio sp.]
MSINVQRILSALILNLLLGVSANAAIDRSQLTDPQRAFLEAYEAIKANDRPLIARYKQSLKDYSLYPYIVYLDYKYHLSVTPDRLVEYFIERHSPQSPLPRRLKDDWLRKLGKQKNWTLYLKHFEPDEYRAKDLQCYAFQARLAKGQTQTLNDDLLAFWQANLTLPRSCQNPLAYLRQNDLITGARVWDKVARAMQKGHTKTARRLARDLSAADQKQLDFWIAVYRQPKKIENAMPDHITPVIRKQIFKQALHRISYSDPEKALSALALRTEQYGLGQKEHDTLHTRLSLRLAYRHHPKAKAFLKQVDAQNKNLDAIHWEMRVAIREGDWEHYLSLYEQLPRADQGDTRWQYWLARALDVLNKDPVAIRIWEDLAKSRSYYGFLSADRLNLPYQFNPAASTPTPLADLKQKYPQIEVMQELKAIGWQSNFKREWYHLLDQLDEADFEGVAKLMSQWNHHSLAIQTVSRVQKWDDLSLRFPTPYKKPILQAANDNQIDPAWVYGVIRRESAFSADISSPAGAIGLMQLLPRTARYIGRQNGFKKRAYTHLTQPESNIALGSAYLRYLIDKYQGNRVLATAAYNAGPKRVDAWLPQDRPLPADRWVETIPFNETRKYVKAVLEYTTIFKSSLQDRYDRLENVMPIIPPKQSGQ